MRYSKRLLKKFVPVAGSLVSRMGARVSPRTKEKLSYPTSSFPYVSGDTFKLMSGYQLEANRISLWANLSKDNVFVRCDLARSVGFLDMISEILEELPSRPKNVLVHNGDIPPSHDTLQDLVERCAVNVYAVNVVEESAGISALPIGLENAALMANGRMELYLSKQEIPGLEVRIRPVICSFHIETNPTVRAPVARMFGRSRHGFDGIRWKRGEYRQALREALFVVSPPGNGLDCHRTWEAIAHGAVPVVLKSAIAPSISVDMPMLVVSSYEDFLGMSDSELHACYEELSKLSPYALMASYWAKTFG